MQHRKLSSVVVALMGIGAVSAHAQTIATSDAFGYTGTVTYYSTLSDAESNTGGTQYVMPQRDGAFYLGVGNPNPGDNAVEFLTNWFSSSDGLDDGIGNPNNTDYGFLQVADLSNASLTGWSAGFSPDLNSFTVSADGANAPYDGANSFSRLWNAGQPDVGGEGTSGTWLNYAYSLTATGLNGVDAGGVDMNTTSASSFSGSFTGLFQNLSVSSPASNGFYVVDLTVDNTSWAVANGYQNGLYEPTGDTFQAPAPGPTPEPAAMAAMWGTACPFVIGLIRRRRVNAAK